MFWKKRKPKKEFVPFDTDTLPAHFTDDELNTYFTRLLQDLDCHGKRFEMYMTMNTQEKVEFIRDQEEHDKTVPSPEWIVEVFANNFDMNYLRSIQLALKTGRISWVDRFCSSGGHILLLRELSRFSAFSQFFHRSFEFNFSEKGEIIKALKYIADCTLGSKKMLGFVSGIQVIIQSINRYNIDEFNEILYLLLPYVFMEDGPSEILNGFRIFAKINKLPNPFTIFADVIELDPAKASKCIFFPFINGLYTTISNFYDKKIKMIFDIVDSKLMTKFYNFSQEEKNLFGSGVTALLNQIENDVHEIACVFKGEPFRCATDKDISESLLRSKLAAPTLLQLVSIDRNQNEWIDRLYVFLNSFLFMFRRYIISCPQTSFEKIAFASFEKGIDEQTFETPNLPNNSIIHTNSCYENLHKKFNYIHDSDIQRIPENEQNLLTISELKQKNKELQENVDMLNRKIKELSEKLAQKDNEIKENEPVKINEELTQKDNEIKEDEPVKISEEHKLEINENDSNISLIEELKLKNEEICKLKNEYEQIKEENDKLRVSHQKITELSECIPSNFQPTKLNALNVGNILPKNLVDVKTLTTKFEEIKSKISNEDIIDLVSDFETSLKALNDERNLIEKNAKDIIHTFQEDRLSMNKEYNQIRELQNKIIDGVKLGKFIQDDDNDQCGEITPPPNEEPSENFIQIPINKLSESRSSNKEWKNVNDNLIKVNEDDASDYFGIEMDENELLSKRTTKIYQKSISKIGMSPEEISSLINSEKFKINETSLLTILKLPISREEAIRISKFEKDIKTLNDAERLAVLLYRIPNWRDKVSLLIEHHRFDLDITIIIQNLDKISKALQQINTNDKLPIVLGTVLSLLNYLNRGTVYGGATSFSLNDLNLIKDIKSKVHGVKFINYLAMELEKKNVNLVEMQAEFSRLQSAARISINDINSKLNIAQRMLAARPRDPFVRASSRRIYDVMKIVQKTTAEYSRITRNYGIKEELLKQDSMIQTFINFATDLCRASKENKILKPKTQEKPPERISKQRKQSICERGILQKMVTVINNEENNEISNLLK